MHHTIDYRLMTEALHVLPALTMMSAFEENNAGELVRARAILLTGGWLCFSVSWEICWEEQPWHPVEWLLLIMAFTALFASMFLFSAIAVVYLGKSVLTALLGSAVGYLLGMRIFKKFTTS